MKKIIIGALLGIIFAVFLLSTGANIKGAPVLAYVYSDSMEPFIRVNDAFIIWPATRINIGDIVMFRPVMLQAPYITHRIIGFGDNGYITKGDNSPYKDQESGEPEVSYERIIGKVVSVNGQPLIIPGLGSISSGVGSLLGKYTLYLAAFFLVLAILPYFTGSRHAAAKPRLRHRLRLRNLYRSIVIIGFGVVILSIYMGSRVSPVKYLVSEYPGTLGDQVEVNQPGQLTVEARNNGLVPVWTIISGIAPLTVAQAPEVIWPRSAETILLDVAPHRETGIYQGYVQIYNYPVLLPRAWIVSLHKMSPLLAVITAGMSLGLWLTLLFKLLEQVHGFEAWIPLRAIRDKFMRRRMNRAKARWMGRRRIR